MAKSTDVQQIVGGARVVAEVPVGDGTVASDIVNFHAARTGLLDSTFRLMPLIASQWRGPAAQPELFGRGVRGMFFCLVRGDVPELLFMAPGSGSTGGVWRYTPWTRAAGGTNPGLTEARQHRASGTTEASPSPPTVLRRPPCFLQHGARVYFTLGDDGPMWVWERLANRVRVAGYLSTPGPPSAHGPQRGTAPNNGGFSIRGRVGTTDSSWVDTTGAAVGGIDRGHWLHGIVFENTAGGYSPMSPLGGDLRIEFSLAGTAAPSEYLENLTRRYRLSSIPKGPDGTSAVVLVRTSNLERLPDGDTGAPRFMHRIPNNCTEEYVVDIPDGELGAPWQDRAAMPSRVGIIASFGGSLWMFSGSRAYWTEQEAAGSVVESCMQGHWLDVYSNTGDVTAAVPIGGMGDAAPILLVLKRTAVHYVTGRYPVWETGTLPTRAGAESHRVVVTCPDGSVLFYGAGTMWMLEPGAVPVDVGGPVRRRLRRVNRLRAAFGCSWVDEAAGEAVIALPLDDALDANWQFIWDYTVKGWRYRNDVTITAACVVGRVVLLAGTYANLTTVWAYQRGYPGYVVAAPTATYMSGWATYGSDPTELHAQATTNDLVFIIEERVDARATLTTFQDWNTDTTINTEELYLAHPEDDVYVYAGASGTYGRTGNYGDASMVWRSRRFAASRKVVDVPRHGVFAFRLATTHPLALVNTVSYGRMLAPAPGTTPTEGS